MKGKVYLVGGGPGDPELLTLKAVKILARADIVLHDALVSREVLALAAPGAELIDVGKRCGRKLLTQEEINALMVSYAKSHEVVVRLKGGDPLLFGRAGEEMDALSSAGIDFEVVPGVTAAFAAAASAKFPLTDRRFASKVIFLTAHSRKGDALVDFGTEISSGCTLAIYMPGHDYARLQEQLLDSGICPKTRCLLVSHATQRDESSHATEVGKFSLAPRVAAPAILLVGPASAPREIDSEKECAGI